MKFEHTTRFNVGDKLYYLQGANIVETYIQGIKATFKRGSYFGGSDNTLELIYYVKDSIKPFMGEESLLKKYFPKKSDIIKYIAEQI